MAWLPDHPARPRLVIVGLLNQSATFRHYEKKIDLFCGASGDADRTGCVRSP